MEVSKHCSREREKKKRSGIYGQTTKGIAKERTCTSYIGKSIEIL